MTDQREELRPPWSRSDRRIPRTLVRPLAEFLSTSTASATVLFIAVVVAVIWANSPWKESYETFWTTPLKGVLADDSLGKDLRFWINDGLMTIFFLLVGLEIKREFTTGELQNPRTAALPVVAAIGGMAVPALLFLAIAGGSEGSRGWGIPMATDIALALGALALASSYAPPSLKPLMLTLAIADDIGAILVIAIFYSEGGNAAALVVALALLLLIQLAQRAHIRSAVVYVVLGVLVWLATYEAGVHPTIAGAVLGLMTPHEPFQRPAAVSAEAHRIADETSDDPSQPDADAPAWLRLAFLSKEAVSPLARVEHALLPWSSFVIVPLFALANAGVEVTGGAVRGALTSPVALGIVVGLVAGKPIGVWLFSALATRARVARKPADVAWSDLVGMGATAGIGFTVALFVAELAFAGQRELLDEAKVGILVASIVAGVVGHLILRLHRVDETSAVSSSD